MERKCPKCGNVLSDTAKFCNKCGHEVKEDSVFEKKQGKEIKIEKEKVEKNRFYPKRKIIGTCLAIICVIFFAGILMTLNTDDGIKEGISLETFVDEYNQISQKRFDELGIEKDEINISDMDEDNNIYVYVYEGYISNPVQILIKVENENVSQVCVLMNDQYIAGNQDMIREVLEATMEVCDPSLDEEGIKEILSKFNMEDYLIGGAMFGAENSGYEKEGLKYVVSNEYSGWLAFSISNK